MWHVKAVEILCSCSFENMALWHERDISNSSVERIILPDATTLLDYALNRIAGILKNMIVYPDRMLSNMNKTGGLVFSQEVLLVLVSKGFSRNEAYKKVQALAMASWEGPPSFRERVFSDPEINEILTPDEIAACFDLKKVLSGVDTLFKRVGLVV